MKVRNMKSPKTGREVPNQLIIQTTEGACGCEDGYQVEYFQSYSSIIVKMVFGGRRKVYLDEKYWNCSRTTSKYRNIFLMETTRETQAKIDSGEYVLTDLN